jgi:hypothetical protein
MHTPVLAVVVTAIAALSGCGDFGPSARVSVRLPDPPPHWRAAFPDLRAELDYPGAGGARLTAGIPRWGSVVEVECSKGGNGPFLAWPVAGSHPSRALKPAGGLYPSSLASAEEIRLTWTEGPLALAVAALAAAGFDVAGINTARLGERMSAPVDPWTWDIASIASRLAAGEFTSYDLDFLPEATVRIAVGPGEWFLDSPFRGVEATDPFGVLVLAHVSHGRHLLAATDGRLAALWVDRQGAVTLPAAAGGSCP